MNIKDLLTEVAKFAPDYLLDEESDGNVVIILNKQLDGDTLVDF
jgi:hypothetical protein